MHYTWSTGYYNHSRLTMLYWLLISLVQLSDKELVKWEKEQKKELEETGSDSGEEEKKEEDKMDVDEKPKEDEEKKEEEEPIGTYDCIKSCLAFSA